MFPSDGKNRERARVEGGRRMIQWLEHGSRAAKLSRRELADRVLWVHARLTMESYEGAVLEEAADRLYCPRLVPLVVFRWWRRHFSA